MKPGKIGLTNLLLLALLVLGIITAVLLVQLKTGLLPQASSPRATQGAANRSTKAEDALLKTPAMTTKAALSKGLQDLNGTDVGTVTEGLTENSQDAASF